mgnify:CR=1 FL=1
MPFSTYSELKDAVSEWMERNDVSGYAADFITLAEARLNRELKVVETDATLTGTVGSRSLDLSALSIVEPMSLFIVDTGYRREYELSRVPDGQFPYAESNGQPSIWGVDGNFIDLNCPLDEPYEFRFHYRGRFALSDAAPTNSLLQNDPDIYLSATIVWGGMFTEDDAMVARYANSLQTFMSERKRIEARENKALLTTDPFFRYQTQSWASRRW